MEMFAFATLVLASLVKPTPNAANSASYSVEQRTNVSNILMETNIADVLLPAPPVLAASLQTTKISASELLDAQTAPLSALKE